MGIFSGLFRSRDKPANSTQAVPIAFYSAAALPVNW